MGPIAVFDKSFLQSLSVDESVWFAHFFMPVVCPLFYVETLADLEKAVRAGRTPEQEVGIIASKFPESSGVPVIHHSTLARNDLNGNRVPMTGQVPIAGGREVNVEGKRGIVYDESPEAQAFHRWHEGRFLEVERGTARLWRGMLAGLNLERVAENLRAMGVDQSVCTTLDEARAACERLVTLREKSYERMALALVTLGVPGGTHASVFERFAAMGEPPLREFAPYAAHVLSVELFLQFALAAKLISAERASNRIDIAYLAYTPFCHVFISSDRLQERCAPLFLPGTREFVWGEDLKRDLAQINAHFSALPAAEKERGIMAFAKVPPVTERSIVRGLWAKHLRRGILDEEARERRPRNPEADKKLVEHLQKFSKAPAAAAPAEGEVQMMAIQRKLTRKRGVLVPGSEGLGRRRRR